MLMDKNTSTSDEANQQATKDLAQVTVLGVDPGAPVYRLYKRRFGGMVGLESCSLFNPLRDTHSPPGDIEYGLGHGLALVRSNFK
jgi:hypothetical protein